MKADEPVAHICKGETVRPYPSGPCSMCPSTGGGINLTLRELCELAGRLPRTSDGVPIWPGMVVYSRYSHPVHVHHVSRFIFTSDNGYQCEPDFHYSTLALAVAAREKREVQ